MESSTASAPDFLRFGEAAEQYRLSESTWRRLCRSGALPHYKLGERVVLLARSDIEDYLASHRVAS